MSTKLTELAEWVDSVAQRTRPENIHWCTGTAEENAALVNRMLDTGDLLELDRESHPECYLHRSDPEDVARVEHLTYVCTTQRDDAGPNNNWMAPDEAHELMDELFEGCMEGRTLYVIPYCMGPINSPFARLGVEITDSPYVVANMRIMTRMGSEALARIEREGRFVRGLHSTGELDPERRFIMHFPEELQIQSYGSGYGGNALLGKKCHALRIASYQARSEGWLAEHMMIVGIENPEGETRYVAAAFPSACGKTNLAMLIPPEPYRSQGWKLHTIGDDICWLQPGEDGRLYAINPEAGFFGVAPGTSDKTNPNALAMLDREAIFTNVATTEGGQPWWEGLGDGEPALDWKGEPCESGDGPAAHPNARFTVSIRNCPSYAAEADAPGGVPIDAIIFGGRRATLAPLVMEAEDWEHGTFIGAAMASETTAAATGKVGVVRRDPMAMKPFCGYHFGDYWAHWLKVGSKLKHPPKIFQVNWFRRDADGGFIWPGFSENLRVLEWILKRCRGEVGARQTPVGLLPQLGDISIEGLADAPDMQTLLAFEPSAWVDELAQVGEYLEGFAPRVPSALVERVHALRGELRGAEAVS